MYKIYINETVFLLTDSAPEMLESYIELDHEHFNFSNLYNQIKNETIARSYLLLTPDFKNLFKQIKKSFKMIKAAGGLVSNEENKYLFIYRKEKWDLPKGKIENGEKTKIAAVREVEEECGIKVTQAGAKICKTYHSYEIGGKAVLKKTTWYWMRADYQQNLIPQLEEDITDAKWVAPGDFMMIKQNTYPLICDVISVIEY